MRCNSSPASPLWRWFLSPSIRRLPSLFFILFCLSLPFLSTILLDWMQILTSISPGFYYVHLSGGKLSVYRFIPSDDLSKEPQLFIKNLHRRLFLLLENDLASLSWFFSPLPIYFYSPPPPHPDALKYPRQNMNLWAAERPTIMEPRVIHLCRDIKRRDYISSR